MITVKELSKSYKKGEFAVNSVSFTINKGEIVGLLGPNGAGKSTIMRILTGYIAPTSGKVLIDGKDILDDPVEIKRLIGYMPENTPLYTDMTAYEFLKFSAKIRGISENKIDSSIEYIVELTDISDVISKKIKQLSRGYQKRVGLASVMIHNPEILILDEPTAGLDPHQVIAFRRIIRRFSKEKTIILSTHVLSEIEATCERVIIIKKGQIIADNSIQKLIEQNFNEECVEFSVEADDLDQLEKKLDMIKDAWKLEFVKKEAKNCFKFFALVHKGSNFEKTLRSIIDENNFKLKTIEKKNINLEELFLKYTQGEE